MKKSASGAPEGTSTPRQRFTDLGRRLFAVPKAEALEKSLAKKQAETLKK